MSTKCGDLIDTARKRVNVRP